MDSPHVDLIDGLGKVNIAHVKTDKFTCTFTENGTIQDVTPLTPEMHNVGDIAYWNGSKIAFTPYASWSSSLGTPIGVCFIPTFHALVWGNGKARFIALSAVNGDGTPTGYGLKWSIDSSGATDAGLTKYTALPTWDNTIGGSIGWAALNNNYISSNKFTDGIQNVIDSGSKYEGHTPYVPSPYAADGSFYSDYIRTRSSGNNALSDFNGKYNTSQIVSVLGDTAQAAKGCSLYSTVGTSPGDWYLPAAGELGYLLPRFTIISNAFNACSKYLNPATSMWGSTEKDKSYTYQINASLGVIGTFPKTVFNSARPIIQLD